VVDELVEAVFVTALPVAREAFEIVADDAPVLFARRGVVLVERDVALLPPYSGLARKSAIERW